MKGFDFHKKMQFLELVVRDHCKSMHISLVCYVMNPNKDKKSMAEFHKLSALNDGFEHSLKTIFRKYFRNLEGKTGVDVVVSNEELNAFTKAYNLQKDLMKKEFENLTLLGASEDALDRLEVDIADFAAFYRDFIEEVQDFK
jgi:acyl-homoserine lactone acylase PvdQ